MRLVDRPVFKPMRCAALPYVGQTHQHARWIDTGSELDGFDNHVYLSSLAVEEAAKLLGFPSRSEHASAKADLASALETVRKLRARLDELEAQVAAIDKLKTAGLLEAA